MIRLRVKEVAEAKGVSRLRLSRIADVNYKTIQGIWRDPYREISIRTLEKLARALKVPSSELIEDVPDMLEE
ncbi:MAG TPA: helix-turn-helix transcriptional regulator [Ktedonobacteraceae bacterium]|jgi:DNA-binding Xre family transcriptional regulator|nr:helix-turn-helix transcriptional regulator [Ktedonobacteraceae bacterium]